LFLKLLVSVRAIVCGGDGTVMWVVSELVKANIKIAKCPIGIIPFGTGNDFSRVLNWGPTAPSSLIGPYMRDFKNQVNNWLFATISDYDIWDVTVVLQEGGEFLRIDKQKNGSWTKIKLAEKSMTKHLCNYFSFGVDSRIGLGFDKHRTQSVCGNKCVYCWEGFKKMFIKTDKIKDIVEKFYVAKDLNNIESQSRVIFD
jgi:diacylglycerol kinase (ATP)